jgi:Lantibiotic modifying enzyme
MVIEMVERASTMRERLSGDFLPRPSAVCEHVSGSIDAWCASAAKGDARTFARRLALDGLDLSSVERAVGAVSIAPSRDLPEWAILLERYFHALPQHGEFPRDNADKIPFEEIFLPLAGLVERELGCILGDELREVSSAARRGLRTTLLKRLARSAAPTLYERFDSHRAARSGNGRGEGENETPCNAPRGVYREYVRGMLGGGMVELLREFPSLARIVATVALLWRDASAELLARLHEDRTAIANYFDAGREPGALQAVESGMSDAHAGGRTVHFLTFASGLRLVYKPRGLRIDAAFGELLAWLTLRGAPLPRPRAAALAVRVLDRGSYGWAEYVEHHGCVDLSAVGRYYQNAGALLALLHSLGATDCHYENIVASGERPVIVDLETVLQPEIARSDPPLDQARNFGARRLYDDSVLRTGMLPAWQRSGEYDAYDIGGLSANGDQTTPFTSLRWRAINSDAMRAEHGRATTGSHPNFPVLGGRAVPPAAHVDDIVLGFRRMYEWLAAHRDLLLSPDGPVERLAREKVRFIARPSSVYDHVLRRSLRSDALRDGTARDIELELLARGLLPLSQELWPLLEEEERALELLDIPIFTMRGDATRLTLGKRSVPVQNSGLGVATVRLAALGPADLDCQLHIIRASFALRYFGDRATPHGRDEEAVREADARDATPLSHGEILASALEIAAELRRMALVDRRGDVTWITTEPISRAGHHRLQATGYGLYDGLAGMALFLAAAARCDGDPGLADVARRALRPIRERLRSSSPAYADEYGIGGACGAASAIYALLRAGTLLNDGAVFDDALLAAHQITPYAIARDSRFDVLYGSAGAILALLALYRSLRSDQLLELANECGKHLLAHRKPSRTPCGTTHLVWLTTEGRAHIGFAHGCAGIALALFRLHAATGITQYLVAALDAVRYEDSLLRIECGERPLARAREVATDAERSTIAQPANWCRGASGVGIARLASVAGSHATELRASAERALATVVSDTDRVTASLDCACCGASAATELLLAAGLRWGEPTLLAAAQQRASRMVRRSRVLHGYRLSISPGAQFHDPALYRGTAGIGYGLLRLCHPELLPSFLSWE